jgi:archaellum biogenesis ATPase FlaH
MKVNTFRTEIMVPSSHPISLKDKILTTGSCFADQFGDWLSEYKFDVLVNPFGSNYNPISIHQNLVDALQQTVNENLLINQQEIWHHFDYHSKWSSHQKTELISSITLLQETVKARLQVADVLIITYGTAWVYEYRNTGHIVANCHKVAAKEFEKRLLSTDEILNSFTSLYTTLKKISPNTRVIITISPVRHVKDTLVLNSVSKAVLRLACHQLVNQFKDVEYFPSFEIMMDDLRDYRFYDRDKIHPSEEAIEYISHKFSDRYFSNDVKAFINKWQSIKQSMEHKAYHPNSPAHQLFLKDLLQKLDEIKGIVSVEEEISQIQAQLNHV